MRARFSFYAPYDELGDLVFACVGQLQFEVMQYRLRDEYGVETHLSPLPFQCSAWLIGDIKTFKKPSEAVLVKDRRDRPVVLFTSTWEKNYASTQNPEHQLVELMA